MPDALIALGFGFVELGGVVPKPQSGNAKPLVFAGRRGGHQPARLDSDELLIGARPAARRRRGGIVGVNIGANKDLSDRAAIT